MFVKYRLNLKIMTVFRIKEKENSLITEDAHELICYATISEINSWNDVANLYSEIKQKHFPKKSIITFRRYRTVRIHVHACFNGRWALF